MLLAIAAGALLRSGVATSTGLPTGRGSELLQVLSLALYAPLCDGAGNEGTIGPFSDWRDIHIAAGPGAVVTVLGLTVQLEHVRLLILL